MRKKSRVSEELIEKKGNEGGLTMRKAEYTTLLAVGMTWPPPRCSGSCATSASRILNLTFLMAERRAEHEEVGSAKLEAAAAATTYAHRTAAPPWCPTGSPGRCCL